MGALQPYRFSARATPALYTVPRSVTIGLAVGAWGFATGAAMWAVNRTMWLFWPASAVAVYPRLIYAWAVEAAVLVTAVLCSWRPVPGSRSHVFARVAVMAWIVAVLSERWPDQWVTYKDECDVVRERLSDPPLLLGTHSCARVLLWLSLAGVALAAGRRFALPRWLPVVAAGLGATLAEPGLEAVLHGRGTDVELVRVPTFMFSLPELIMLVVFAAAFASVAFAVRKRPLLDQDAVLSTRSPRKLPSRVEMRAFDHWSASSSVVLASVLALSNLAMRELDGVVPLGGWHSVGRDAFVLSLPVLFVLVERARRKDPARSSFAPTLAAGFGVLFGVVSCLTTTATHLSLLHDLALGVAAFTLGGIALLLPDIPKLGRSVARVKGALFLGVLFMVLFALVDLTSVASRCSVVDGSQRQGGHGEWLLLLAAFVFVTLAAHFGRPIERAILIARAFATKEGAGPTTPGA